MSVKYKVIARAGIYVPGVGSRNYGEFFEVDGKRAELLEGVPGLERLGTATQSRKRSKPAPVVDELLSADDSQEG